MKIRVTNKELPAQLRHRLNMYTLAAGGAAMGMLAQAPTAEAKVVFTPGNHVIFHDSTTSLDLNHDGKVDFYLNQTQGCTTDGICNARLYAYVPFYHDHGNAVAGQGQWPFHALALRQGSEIGPQLPFGASALYFRSGSVNGISRVSGSWIDVMNRYLGLKFKINGEIHYGWARLDVYPNTSAPVAKLTGFAYETVAGKPIRAGQTVGDGLAIDEGPASQAQSSFVLAALALGARGIPIWRREESTVTGTERREGL